MSAAIGLLSLYWYNPPASALLLRDAFGRTAYLAYDPKIRSARTLDACRHGRPQILADSEYLALAGVHAVDAIRQLRSRQFGTCHVGIKHEAGINLYIDWLDRCDGGR